MVFSLFRLPSLSIDEVLKSMGSLEQFAISLASNNLKASIRRLTKKCTLHINESYSSTPESVSFGLNLMKLDRVVIRDVIPEDRQEGVIYWEQRVPTTYSLSHGRALTLVFERLLEVFAPKSVYSQIYDFEFKFPVPPNTFSVQTFSKNWFDCVTTVSLSSLEEVPVADDEHASSSLEIHDGSWLSLSDMDTVVGYTEVKLHKTRLTSEELIEFCEGWVNRKDAMMGSLEVEVEEQIRLDLQLEGVEMVNEAAMNSKVLRDFNPTTCYRICSGQHRYTYMCSKDNKFLLHVAW